LLPEHDLPLRILDDRAFLDFLGPEDEPWLRVLIAELSRFEGRRRRELAERLAEPLPCEAPYFKRRAATRVLLRLWRGPRPGPSRPTGAAARRRPSELRGRLFGAAAAGDRPTEAVLAEVAGAVGLSTEALLEAVFGDLPGERIVVPPDPCPTPREAALLTNLAIGQAVLTRTARVELRIEGGARPVVRLAKLRGLLCTVADAPDAGLPLLEISGPFSLFRHTLIYGRSLAEILPHLAWCARFELGATAVLHGRLVRVSLASGDPIFPAAAPRPFDSGLEERFARDVARLAPDWDVVREPEPIRSGRSLIFPDFLLRHRLHPERRALVEIVGFWTPAYLEKKLERLREADVPAFVVCIDEARACAPTGLPAGWPVLAFRKRVDAAAVLREVERLTAHAASSAA
jgi:predicted nuclease of restriction endonuclease-like RecB superfamily